LQRRQLVRQLDGGACVLGSPARVIVRFRFLLIAFWVVVAAFAIPRASRVHDVLEVEGRRRS
jgi:hypothetical protein